MLPRRVARASALSLAAALTFAIGGDARAQGLDEDPDTAAARRHFEQGRELYGAGRFEAACAEFETANRVKPLPAFDYNLAKCNERLERWDAAIVAYERYLQNAPGGDAAPEVRARIDVLRARVDGLRAHVVARSDDAHRRLRIAAISTAVVAVAVLGGATGGYLSQWSDYSAQRDACTAHPCAPADYADLSTRVHRAEIAGYTLWAIGGALALADIGLWVAATRPARRAHVWAAPGIGALVVGGAF